MTIENLFYEMKDLTQKSEKFFMNHHVYRGHHVVVFDYSLTIPGDFSSQAALECRGSVFEVDEDMNFVQCLCRPYEKFLNSHEYDYDHNEGLYRVVKELYGVNVRSSDDVKNLPVKYALEKLDGSIIQAFDFHGELDLKSNSSLTSDYKHMAQEWLESDQNLFDKSKELTDQGYTVIYEMLSSSPKYQIVLTYDTDRLIVTGVRHNVTGQYLTLNEIREHFGAEYVVSEVSDWSWKDASDKENMEGYVIVTESGLRVKMKTEWYVMHHNTKENFLSTARHFWEAYIRGDTDDVFLVIKGNDVLVKRFNELLEKCDALYTKILKDGHEFYNAHANDDMRDYFTALKKQSFDYDLSNAYASMLKNFSQEDALARIDERLVIKKNISRLGISDW